MRKFLTLILGAPLLEMVGKTTTKNNWMNFDYGYEKLQLQLGLFFFSILTFTRDERYEE